MNVGDRVRFVGPAYGYGAGGPSVGQLGTVKERAGYRAQAVGEDPVELVTVHFDGDKKASVVSIGRLESAKEASSENETVV